MNRTGLRLLALALLLGGLASEPLSAQIPGALRRAAGRAVGRAAALTPDELLHRAPITTSLDDARWAVPALDGFVPPMPMVRLGTRPRTPSGGYLLEPGYYGTYFLSFCLRAGTHGPGGGDGYLYAPLEGPASDAVATVVRNAPTHPDITQGQVQLLLWAIISQAQFDDLDPGLRAVAAQLLTPVQLATLNRDAIGTGVEVALNAAPPLVRQTLEAESRLRELLMDPGATYEQLARVAVLVGEPLPGPGSREVPSGRWSRHPDGYYVRYIPTGYTRVWVEVWVPDESWLAAGPAEPAGEAHRGPAPPPDAARRRPRRVVADPGGQLAMPGNTARQRLLIMRQEAALDEGWLVEGPGCIAMVHTAPCVYISGPGDLMSQAEKDEMRRQYEDAVRQLEGGAPPPSSPLDY